MAQAIWVAPAGSTIEIVEGVCHLDEPLQLRGNSALTLRGQGPASILSGGRPVDGWAPVVWPGAPPGAVYVADTTGWPVEIKSLRAGSALIPRSRWPPLQGAGLETPNWLFAMPWSEHPPSTSGGNRLLHQLGLNASQLPAGANLSDLVGAYAHVLGCVEKDVNSQLTKILSVNSSDTTEQRPLLAILFRNTFTTYQRFYLENVRWALSPGTFYLDASGRLFYWPADGRLPPQGTVVAPVLDRLIELTGAQGHTVKNLTFTDTTYFADGFWDGPAQQPSDAAVRINACSNVSVASCNFLAGLGGYGVAIGNASEDIAVSGSLFDSVGQGGVIAYGFDGLGPIPAGSGRAAGNNTKPRRVSVTHCVMRNLGQQLAHVAGVALRAASDCTIAHNRISKTPRYAIQADSFYPGAISGASLVSSGNVVEFNILNDSNRLTSDTGAIEMLGSGDPSTIGWWNNNLIRFNRISHTVGSSSSDGKHVCVHGVPDEGCRRLVWGALTHPNPMIHLHCACHEAPCLSHASRHLPRRRRGRDHHLWQCDRRLAARRRL